MQTHMSKLLQVGRGTMDGREQLSLFNGISFLKYGGTLVSGITDFKARKMMLHLSRLLQYLDTRYQDTHSVSGQNLSGF